jgi:PAS domain S-box-containing protein
VLWVCFGAVSWYFGGDTKLAWYAMKDNEYRVILDSVADGVFTVDMSWRITSFNRAAEKITGVPRQDALGKPCCEVFRADVCETDCVLRKTMESGRPIVSRRVHIVRADGERVPISVSTALLRDGSGRVIGGVETFRDLRVEEELRKELHQKHSFADIVSRSHRMKELFRMLPAVARSESTVLVEGESGTGKELVARAIHDLSPRKQGAFVVVNCGALPDTLLESELFGHKAGAFTDARADRKGRFEAAAAGTIFLDEIGDVSSALQARLLRVLQERTIQPLGANDTVKVDVRVIAASNRHLEAEVAAGRFRQDLYYRVNVVKLRLPPLRDRREDIPLLAAHFVLHFNRLTGKTVEGVSREALALLMQHDWPGNVRELENAIEHAFVLCPGHLITPEHLPVHLRPSPALEAATGLRLKDIEARAIWDALQRNQWRRMATARELGIHKNTLRRKMKELGLTEPGEGSSAETP